MLYGTQSCEPEAWNVRNSNSNTELCFKESTAGSPHGRNMPISDMWLR
jgi:hypothetical protein